jgi:hypothetical protein
MKYFNNVQYKFYNAAMTGNTAEVERLLRDPIVDPSDDNNWTIRYAYTHGHLAVVERLLQDPRVDPNTLHYLWLTDLLDIVFVKIDRFSEKTLMILAAKLSKDFPAHSDIISLKPRIDKYREELFAIADDLTVVLDETLDNNGLQRNIWEMVYEYLEHKLPER